MTLPFAGSLAACQSTGNASDGAGYSLLTPNAASRSAIIANDRTFAEQIAAHNRQCRADKGCAK